MDISGSNRVSHGNFGLLVLMLLSVCGRVQAATVVDVSGTPPTSATVGTFYSFQPSLLNTTGRAPYFSINGKPAWASFNASTGRLSGTPQTGQTGTYSNIIIYVKAGGRTDQLPAFAIKVLAPNRAPVISGTPASQVVVGSAYWFKPTASDADGNTLTFSIANRPSWVYFNTATGSLSGTPKDEHVGSHESIVVSVSDGRGGVAKLPAFSILVKAANRAPTISGVPVTQVLTGTAYNFKPLAADADGDALSFTIANKPVWATFNSSTGQLSGTPAAADVGVFANIAITVRDARGATASLAAFTIAVTQAANGRVSLNWVAPTENSDGTPLLNLAGYRIHYGTTRGGPYTNTVTLANPSISAYVIENLTPTTYYIVMTATSATGLESPFSGELTTVVN